MKKSTAQKTLALIGAGPKSLAVAAKNKVLREIGFDVPQIVIFEKESVGFNWSEHSGLTNGDLPLGTSPLKDIGFPYYSFHWREKNSIVNSKMLAYSWQNFLIETYQYSDWVDRGQPPPVHREWLEYLNWVFEKIEDSIHFVHAQVKTISYDDRQWQITTESLSGESKVFSCDGIVTTGPGEIALPGNIPEHSRVLTATNFWRNYTKFDRGIKRHVALIGTGENAATIAIELGKFGRNTTLEIICPNSMSYSRGESYLENHVYTDPIQMNWYKLTYQDKQNFINRTDRGVFSLAAKEELNILKNIELIPGYFTSVTVDSLDQLVVDFVYNNVPEKRIYDMVILAMGFRPWEAFTRLLDEKAIRHIKETSQLEDLTQQNVEMAINDFLALDKVTPYIHLPMLAAIKQGPGFPNLSCLGRLSDHVLMRYISVGNFADLAESLYH